MMYKKIKDHIVTWNSEEYDIIIDTLGKISGLSRT